MLYNILVYREQTLHVCMQREDMHSILNHYTRGTLRAILDQLEPITKQVGEIEGKDRQCQMPVIFLRSVVKKFSAILY